MTPKILVILVVIIILGAGGIFIYQKISSTEKGGTEEEIKTETPETGTPAGEEKVAPTGQEETAPAGEEEAVMEESPVEEKEIVNISQTTLKNCIGFLAGDNSEISTIKQIGAGWVRAHPGPFSWGYIEQSKGNYNFQYTDDLVKTAQTNNIAILATIWPFAEWDQKICHNTECEVSSEDQFYPKSAFDFQSIPASRCKPCNMGDYQNFLKKLVERYDGDGVDDMAGLKIPIKYYETLNEPELNESFLTFFNGTSQEYVDILKTSYETIKEVCPDCKIVQAGAAGIEQRMLSFWSEVFTSGANYFDIANIHYINNGDRNTLNVKDFKNLMNQKGIIKPLWVTEAQYSQDKNQEIASTVEGALQNGAEKIFFTRFTIGQSGAPIPGQYSSQYVGINSKCPQ